jgi:hypothetical protein
MYPDHRRQLEERPDQQTSRSEAQKNDSMCEFIHLVSMLIVPDGKRHAIDGASFGVELSMLGESARSVRSG